MLNQVSETALRGLALRLASQWILLFVDDLEAEIEGFGVVEGLRVVFLIEEKDVPIVPRVQHYLVNMLVIFVLRADKRVLCKERMRAAHAQPRRVLKEGDHGKLLSVSLDRWICLFNLAIVVDREGEAVVLTLLGQDDRELLFLFDVSLAYFIRAIRVADLVLGLDYLHCDEAVGDFGIGNALYVVLINLFEWYHLITVLKVVIQ